MKKTIKAILSILLVLSLVGCKDMMNNPTKKVEGFLSKYQTLDKEVLEQLDKTLNSSENFTDSQKERYRDIMKKQYKDMTYNIKETTEDGNNATVVVEIEVYNYGTAISQAENYLLTNRDEFIDTVTNEVSTTQFLEYKITQMENVKDKIKYTINFTLTKTDNEWKLDGLNDVDRQKLHGLYY